MHGPGEVTGLLSFICKMGRTTLLPKNDAQEMCVTLMLSTGFIKEQSLFLHCSEFSFSHRNRNPLQHEISKDLPCYTGLICTPCVYPAIVFTYPHIHLCTFPSSIHLPIHSSPIHLFPSLPIHLAISLPTIHLLLINLPPTHPTIYNLSIHPATHFPPYGSYSSVYSSSRHPVLGTGP